jgi:hypothetical protein
VRWTVFAFLIACSGSTPMSMQGDDAPPPPGDGSIVPGDSLSKADACMMYATARCTQLQTCSASDLAHDYGPLAACESRQALECTQRLKAVDTGDTESTMLACGAALAGETCAAFLGNSLPAACITAGPNSGTCAFLGQCATSYCAIGASTLCGVCQDTPVAGASCADQSCGNTLVCDGNNHLCAVPAESGKPCNATIPCDHGLACVGDTAQQNGTCQPEVATLGGACDSTRKTRATCSADAGLTCSTTTAKCVALPLAATGAACGVINGTETECAAGGTCNATTNKCVAPAGDGSACDTKNGPGCFFPARCIPSAPGLTTGTCQLDGSSPSC